jgi:spermidine synthase
VILLSLAAGYRCGGWLADRRPGPEGMYAALLGAGVLDLLLPLGGRWAISVLGAGITATPVSVILLSLLSVLAVIAPPVFLLAVATPFALRLGVQVQPAGRAGTAVGALEAWATGGSIAGTFLPALVTIPFLGVNQTLVGLGAILILTGALGLRRARLLGLLGLPVCVGILTSGVVRPVPGLLYEAQSLYQFIQVYRRGTMTYLTVNEGAGIQSAWNSASPLTGLYYDAYMLLPGLRPGTARRVLVIGAGGGTILRQYQEVLSGRYRLALTGVEIDPDVAALGVRYFGLPPALAADVHVDDGRTFLRTLPPGAPPYDIVIVDAYSQELYIPYELATVQFYELVRRHLAPGGIVALNVNALSPRTPLLLSLERTLHAVFPYTYAAKVGGEFNYLVAASTAPIDAPRLLRAGAVPPLLGPLAAELLAGWRPVSGAGGWLLTDNRAPLDYLTDLELLQGMRDAVTGRPIS